MPELPEVETIRNTLRLGTAECASLLGKTICKVALLWSPSVVEPCEEEFLKSLPGQMILEIGRRGKYLIFSLSRKVLLFHLGMSGDLLVEPLSFPFAPHYRLVLFFDDGQRLAFNDPRKFGRIWLLDDPLKIFATLGPEPLDEDLTVHDLFQRLQRHRRQLKPLLLDQGFLAGMGNIYVDEVLFAARLHPMRLSHHVTFQESERLLDSMRSVLQEAILRNGSSIDWVYQGGEFQNSFHVYQRTGEPCLECGTTIQRIKLGQRGTHFCPSCQK